MVSCCHHRRRNNHQCTEFELLHFLLRGPDLPGLAQYNLEEGLNPWPQLLLGSLGGVVVTLLGGWDIVRHDVL